MTAFIVEDNAIQCLVLKMLLNKLGLQLVGMQENGNKAVTQIIEKKPAIVFLDIMLTDSFDGICVAREIKKVYNPIIVYVTGNSDHQTKNRAEEIGFHDFISKPVSLGRLKKCIPLTGSYN
ncbi:response regulator [Rhodohalobacter sp. SW132]|uniref:response regulator n=1 Tax=Rhodohalobacter sp. SW132 TaxID=2293433 RepID=UPI000E22F6EF|nr:response regulator [Rhodohalobacter sp. SW132]REL33131.1 response regulator [Rhodohalobacter sp. SW132]